MRKIDFSNTGDSAIDSDDQVSASIGKILQVAVADTVAIIQPIGNKI